MDKQSLRKIYLEKRRSLNADKLGELSDRISQQFSFLSFSSVEYIHLFYPIAGKNEVDSLKIAEWLRTNKPDIKLVLSKSDLTSHSLQHILWDEETEFAVNSWGITEPVWGKEVKAEDLDMVIIPLLAYDMQGNRLGYGKGFYDRFLAECRDDALKVGLSFFGPEPKITGTDGHDIPLDLCLTPETIWKFNSNLH
jgi:5-formyltetrahydrofolate cyclo-ligase